MERAERDDLLKKILQLLNYTIDASHWEIRKYFGYFF